MPTTIMNWGFFIANANSLSRFIPCLASALTQNLSLSKTSVKCRLTSVNAALNDYRCSKMKNDTGIQIRLIPWLDLADIVHNLSSLMAQLAPEVGLRR